jgi:hypothetical protein
MPTSDERFANMAKEQAKRRAEIQKEADQIAREKADRERNRRKDKK